MTPAITLTEVQAVLKHVMDPEIPVLSVLDLGMITEIQVQKNEITVKMIPTFLACPAVEVIKRNIRTALEEQLPATVRVEVDHRVHWNSSRLSEAAKEKLLQFGIAPPPAGKGETHAETLLNTECPHCGSKNTYLRSPFGATLCRAIHYCKNCGIVFEQFKPLE